MEEHLPQRANLGAIDIDTLPKEEANTAKEHREDTLPELDSLLNLHEIEELATKKLSRKAWAYYFSAGSLHSLASLPGTYCANPETDLGTI